MKRDRRRRSGSVITVAGLAVCGWVVMSAVAVPSYASNGNGKGLATAPGQVSKATAAAPTASTTTPASAPATTSSTATTGSTATTSATTATTPVTTGATVGDPTQPQPLSSADLNAGGANNGGDCGAYCSTRDGSASKNGNGGGAAVGRPCAGCVGKADNKNPPGQQPDGTDHNNGYECDGNSGIARTNPAHTGCTTTTTPPTTCVDTNSCGGTDCTKTNTCGGTDCTKTNTCGGTDCTKTNSCGGNQGDCTLTHTCPSGPPVCVPTQANDFCSTVLAVHHPRPTTSTPPTTVLGVKLVRTPPPSRTPNVLPFTGADVLAEVLLAAMLIGCGGAAMRVGRRRDGRLATLTR